MWMAMPVTDPHLSVAERNSAARIDRAPLVSVVIPTYNRASLLRRALQSVFTQTFTSLEIICVDDASSDNTEEVVKACADPRLRYIRHATNRGGSAARNTGIRAATGDYIAFLDDDDEWLPEKIERQLKVLETYDAVLCSAKVTSAQPSEIAGVRAVVLDDFRTSPYAVGGTGVLMAKAKVLRETLFDESLPRCQDWDLFIRIAHKYRIGFLDERLLKYNNGEHVRLSNVLVKLPTRELEKRLVMLDKHKEFFGARLYKRHLSSMLLYGIKHRPDRLRHLAYTMWRCGLSATLWALGVRLRDKIGLAQPRRASVTKGAK